MAADALNNGGAGCVAGGPAGSDLDAAWFEPTRRWALRSDPRVAGRIDIALLNRFAAERVLRTEDGLPLRFVDAGQAPLGAYELVIRDTGAVPTRVQGAGMLHDWFNALAWLAFPRIKARLNRLHSDAVAAAAGASANQGRRGALRDAATVFDESGALFVCRDASLLASLRRRDWHGLFVDGRARFADAATVCVVGHGVCEKLLAPYKALCAHAWIVELEPDLPSSGAAMRSMRRCGGATAAGCAASGASVPAAPARRAGLVAGERGPGVLRRRQRVQEQAARRLNTESPPALAWRRARDVRRRCRRSPVENYTTFIRPAWSPSIVGHDHAGGEQVLDRVVLTRTGAERDALRARPSRAPSRCRYWSRPRSSA